jgi:4-amino-4-deoxy-L-arabinose transferase-like glycosyltransferase
MWSLIKKHQHKLVLALLLGLFLATRLPYFCSGLQFLEPDELDHLLWAKAFKQHRWPVFSGRPYFEQVPLFSWLASRLPFFSACPFFPVRLLSLLGSAAAAVFVFLSVSSRQLIDKALAVLFFILLPLVMFYSKTGVLDMLMLAGLTASFYFFQRQRSLKDWWLAGIFWGLAVLIKTAALFFGLVFAFNFIDQLTRQKLKKTLSLYLRLSAGFFLTVIPVFLLFWLSFKRFHPAVPLQILKVPSQHFLPLTNLTVHLATVWIYLQKAGYLFSPLFLPLIGWVVISPLKSRRPGLKTALWPILAVLVFLGLFRYSPRYILYLAPFASILVGNWMTRPRRRLLIGILLLSFLPSSYQAFRSLNHQAFQSINRYFNSSAGKPALIYTSYLPEKVSYFLQLKAEWLDLKEIKPGDYILLEELRSRDLASFGPKPNLKQDIEYVRRHFQPLLVISETSPNFPYTKEANQLELYRYEYEE